MAEKITIKCECGACNGTGLYMGWTCHEGAAQICRECKGTGMTELSYVPFTGRKEMQGVKRVFPTTSGIHLYPDTHSFNDGVVYFGEYGCSYEDWKAGVEPKPIKF